MIAETNMQDIITIFYEMKPRVMSVFVSKNVNNLPPLSMNNFDMAHIIEEMSNIKCKMSICKRPRRSRLQCMLLCVMMLQNGLNLLKLHLRPVIEPRRKWFSCNRKLLTTHLNFLQLCSTSLVTLLNMEWTVTMKTW